MVQDGNDAVLRAKFLQKWTVGLSGPNYGRAGIYTGRLI